MGQNSDVETVFTRYLTINGAREVRATLRYTNGRGKRFVVCHTGETHLEGCRFSNVARSGGKCNNPVAPA